MGGGCEPRPAAAGRAREERGLPRRRVPGLSCPPRNGAGKGGLGPSYFLPRLGQWRKRQSRRVPSPLISCKAPPLSREEGLVEREGLLLQPRSRGGPGSDP